MSFVRLLLLCLLVVELAAQVAEGQEPTKRALIVGVADYFSVTMDPLKYAEDDAKDLKKELESIGFEVQMLLGKSAKRESIDSLLNTWVDSTKQLERNDITLTFLSGHGQQLTSLAPKKDSDGSPALDTDGKPKLEEQEVPYFCGHDSIAFERARHSLDGKTVEQIEREFRLVSINRVIEQIATNSNCSNNLIIVDACRNNPGKGKGVDGSEMRNFPPRISILFGAGSGEKSYESSDESVRNGVFAHYMLRGLRGEASDKQGRVTWLGLVNYLSTEVPENGWKLAGNADRKQSPQLLVNNLKQSIVLSSQTSRRASTEKLDGPSPGITKIDGKQSSVDSTSANLDSKRAEDPFSNSKPQQLAANSDSTSKTGERVDSPSSNKSDRTLDLGKESKDEKPTQSRRGSVMRFRGTDGNSSSPERGLLQDWPENGPELVWTATGIGNGDSSVTIDRGQIWTMGCKGDKDEGIEHVYCVNEETGRVIYETAVGKASNNVVRRFGPGSTPTLHSDFVFAMGSAGDLVCIDRSTGLERWRRNLSEEMEGSTNAWGYNESVLVEGDEVICTPGGKTSIVSLSCSDGEEVWSVESSLGKAENASIIALDAGGKKYYAQYLKNGLVLVDAATKKVALEKEASSSGMHHSLLTFNNNLLIQDYRKTRIFHVSSSGTNIDLQEVGEWNSALNGFAPVITDSNKWVALERRQMQLFSLDSESHLCEETREDDLSSLTFADGRLYVRSDRGIVQLFEVKDQGFTKHGQFNLPEREIDSPPCRAYIVICGKRMYVRDNDRLFCYDIAE